MKTTLIALTTGIALLLTQPALAGGPVIEEAEPEVVVSETGRKVPGALWVILGVAVVAAIAGGNDNCNGPDDAPVPTPVGC
jgi:hypothetical protein